jgi:hypothetical protein
MIMMSGGQISNHELPLRRITGAVAGDENLTTIHHVGGSLGIYRRYDLRAGRELSFGLYPFVNHDPCRYSQQHSYLQPLSHQVLKHLLA